jgi:hypothetical protein
MSLFTLVVAILFAGLACWVINRAPFIDPPFKQVATWVILVAVVLWIVFTLFGSGPNIQIPKFR